MSQDYGDQPAYSWDGGREAAPQQMPLGESKMPDSNSDPTPTEGFDFGIGRGNGNDAHGQGAGGYGEYSPSMGDKGVYGPESGLPNDPAGKTHDNQNSDSMPIVERGINKTVKEARQRLHAILCTFIGPPAGPMTGLPGDHEKEVARSDYYTGPKDNDTDSIKGPTENPVLSGIAESELPQSSPPSPPRPLIPRPSHFGEFEFATTQLPGDGQGATTEFDKDMAPGGAYRYERMDEPYTKWDDSTHNMQPDWLNQRDNQGPYAKPGGPTDDRQVVPK